MSWWEKVNMSSWRYLYIFPVVKSSSYHYSNTITWVSFINICSDNNSARFALFHLQVNKDIPVDCFYSFKNILIILVHKLWSSSNTVSHRFNPLMDENTDSFRRFQTWQMMNFSKCVMTSRISLWEWRTAVGSLVTYLHLHDNTAVRWTEHNMCRNGTSRL